MQRAVPIFNCQVQKMNTVIMRLSPGGGGCLLKTQPSRKGAYSRGRGGGGLIQKSVAVLEHEYVVPGKYVAKGAKKRLKVLKK